jgi:chitinase
MWIAQNNNELKEDFLFYLTESLVNGTRGFTRIPEDKLVIGLPANIDAAATGYVINPEALTNAFKRLNAKGILIKGLMTWSINWDIGVSKDHVSYNWEFCRRYGPLINGIKLSVA